MYCKNFVEDLNQGIDLNMTIVYINYYNPIEKWTSFSF